MQQTLQHTISALGVGRILVAGADTEAFLQGQLTQDLRLLESNNSLLAGYCSAKGRLLAVLRLQRTTDGIVLELHRGVLESSLRRLRMFVLRARVTLTELTSSAAETDDAIWRRAQIEQGIPTIFPATSDHFVPQMCNLDLLGGISYDKGCYTGQEVVARLHYLGQIKRRMFRARIAAAANPGQSIFDARGDAQTVGEIVDSIGDGGVHLSLAVLQLSHAEGDLRLDSRDGPRLTDVVSAAPRAVI